MKFRYSFLFSILIHFVLFFFLSNFHIPSPLNSDIEIPIKKGFSANLNVFKKKYRMKQMNSFAKGNKDKNSSEKQEEGSPEEEVRKIQNRISYPPEALEQGLESDCEWMVKVNDRRMVGELKNLRPCRYKVFEQTFLSVIYTWKFNLPSGTILKIPISFEIEER